MILRVSALLAATMAAGASLPALAQDAAHCAAPKTLLERTLCSDEEAAAHDRAMQISYSALLREAASADASPAWTAALAADQQLFLEQREASFDSQTASSAEKLEMLRAATAQRAEALNWYTPNFKPRFPGNWANSQGLVEFVSGNGSSWDVSINVADQVDGAWVCALEGEVTLHSSTHATLETEAGPVNFAIADGLLTISPDICDESGPAHRGSIAGQYFRVGADD